MRLRRLEFHQTVRKSSDIRSPDRVVTSEACASPADVGDALDIVVRAVMLKTCATGVAVGLMTRGQFVCCARVGDTAPDLGVALNASRGITGACVRSAQLLHCYDSGTDKRVDADVCRTLGIRSIVVVPMLVGGHVVGILETLSDKPHAFDSSHEQWLKHLADFARDLSYGANKNSGPALVQNVRGEQQPVLVSSGHKHTSLPSVSGAVQTHSDNERLGHDPGLAMFRGALEKMPQTSTWEDICQQLLSRVEK